MSHCLCTSYVAHFTPSHALVPGVILLSTATLPSQLAGVVNISLIQSVTLFAFHSSHMSSFMAWQLSHSSSSTASPSREACWHVQGGCSCN